MPKKIVSEEDKILIFNLKKQKFSLTEIFEKFDGFYSMSTIRKHAKAEPVYETAKTTETSFKKEKYSKKISKKFAKMLEINPETDFAYTGASLEL